MSKRVSPAERIRDQIGQLFASQQERDFTAYWRFQLAQERRRVHAARYLNELIPGSE